MNAGNEFEHFARISDRHPCHAALIDGFLVIAVSLETIKNATELNPDLETYNDDTDEFVTPTVIDINKFADEVLNALNREDGDGITLVTMMLDMAINDAVESGAEGIKLGDRV